MKIRLKAKDKDGHTREYASIRGGVTLLNDGSISILTGRWLKDVLQGVVEDPELNRGVKKDVKKKIESLHR